MSDAINGTKTSPERKHELMMFVFLTIFLAPIVSIALVGSYGLAIWMYQLIAGPPTG